jgi:hypothetical protein
MLIASNIQGPGNAKPVGTFTPNAEHHEKRQQSNRKPGAGEGGGQVESRSVHAIGMQIVPGLMNGRKAQRKLLQWTPSVPLSGRFCIGFRPQMA